MPHIEVLSADYEALYVKMLTDVATARSRRRQPYCAFWPMRGQDYDSGKGMFLVGRAVNGWMEEDDVGNFVIPGGGRDAREIAHSARDFSERKLDLGWVTATSEPGSYSTTRSAFWQVGKAIGSRCGLIDTNVNDWAQQVCWSNLYKVAPTAGRNPPDSVCNAQLEACGQLLEREVKEFNPRLILMLCGWDWAKDFFPHDTRPSHERGGVMVHHVGTYRGIPCIVARHPQCKPQKPFVDEVLAAWQNGH